MILKINYHFDFKAIALNYILAKKRRKYRLIYVLSAITSSKIGQSFVSKSRFKKKEKKWLNSG